MNIAFFDSGIGGLSVLREAQKLITDENLIYFADSKNLPYGTKSKGEILKLVLDAATFLEKLNLKALVLACNTASSVAVKNLREIYSFPIIAMEPAVKPALALDREKKVLICATDLTLKEEKLGQLIYTLDAVGRIQNLSLQKLVAFAEQNDFTSERVKNYLVEKFKNVNWELFSSIVLGCTHFLYFKKIITDVIPAYIQLIDGNMGTVRNLMNQLPSNESKAANETRFFISCAETSTAHFDSYFKILDKN